ncbi:MAG: glucosaminidase domain-containing protein [Patescibacteria group bacterium]|nr:glucosaminidase domain-containing protein [Patescibacteria group bacterium]
MASTTPGNTQLNFGNAIDSAFPNTQAGGKSIGTIVSPFLSGLGSTAASAIGPLTGNQTTPIFASGSSATPKAVGSLAQSQSPNNGFSVAPGTAYTLNGVNYDASGKALNSVASSQTTVPSSMAIVGNMSSPVTAPTLAQINAPNMSNGQFINDSGSSQNNVAEPPDVTGQVGTTQTASQGTSAVSNEDVNSSMAQNIAAYMNGMANNQQALAAHNQYIRALQDYQNYQNNVIGGQLAQYGIGRPVSLDTGRAAVIGMENQVGLQAAQNQVNTAQQNQQFALGQQQLQASVGQNALQDLLQVGAQGLTQQQINLSALQYSQMTADQKAQYDVQYFQTFGTMPPASITGGASGTGGTSGTTFATPTAFSNNGTTPNMTSTDMMGYDISSYATDPNYASKIATNYQQATSTIGSTISPQSIQNYINQIAPNSPITGQMIYNAALNGGGTGVPVDPYLLAAQEAEESKFGTKGVATSTMNPANIGNTGTSTKTMPSWQAGVNAQAAWLANHPAQQTQQSQQATFQQLQQILPPQLAASGVLGVLSDGTPYFQQSKLGTQEQMAKVYSTQYNIPILSDEQVTKAQALDVTQQNLQNISNLLPNMLSSGIGGKISGTIGTWWNNITGTDQNRVALNNYREAAINAIQAMGGGSGSGFRLNQAEIDNAVQGLPTGSDTLEQAQTKIATFQSMINEWHNQLFPNNPASTNLNVGGSYPSQIQYNGKTYNVDANGDMTPA